MQSVTPLYVSSVLPRFRDCSLVFITESTHTELRSNRQQQPTVRTSLELRLTIDGVDGNGRCAPREAARNKRHIERSRPVHASFAQIIQVGKKGKVDDGERNIPAKGEK